MVGTMIHKAWRLHGVPLEGCHDAFATWILLLSLYRARCSADCQTAICTAYRGRDACRLDWGGCWNDADYGGDYGKYEAEKYKVYCATIKLGHKQPVIKYTQERKREKTEQWSRLFFTKKYKDCITILDISEPIRFHFMNDVTCQIFFL